MVKTIFEEMGGTYVRQGDYFIPCLTLPTEKETKPIGVWEQRHKRYLKQNHRVLYMNLLTSGKLNSYLADIDDQAEEMFSRLVNQMSEHEGVTEKLKASNQLEWVQEMNNIRNRAVEIANAVNCSILLTVYSVYCVKEKQRNRTVYTAEREKCVYSRRKNGHGNDGFSHEYMSIT